MRMRVPNRSAFAAMFASLMVAATGIPAAPAHKPARERKPEPHKHSREISRRLRQAAAAERKRNG